MKIKLSENDRIELVDLYENAQTTPMIQMTTEGNDWATQAWNTVREKMDELGKKYKFNPETMKGIDKKTGEIIIGEIII